jgi:hypothetical protein
MRLFLHEHETTLEVEMASCSERVVGPQARAVIPRCASELERAVEELPAQAVPTGLGVDQEDPQLRACIMVGIRDAKDGADPLAIELRDPGRLSPRLVIRSVVRDDPAHQRLEARVPTELGRVDLTMSHDHPAEVARLTQSADGGLGHDCWLAGAKLKRSFQLPLD